MSKSTYNEHTIGNSYFNRFKFHDLIEITDRSIEEE